MSMSYAEIRRVVAELGPLLVGGRLEKADQTSPTTLVLTLYAQGDKRYLLVATQPGFARIHLTGQRPAREGDVGPFARQARQLLRGRSLAAIELAESDRIVTLTFGRPGEPAGRLVAELTGRTANLYLLGPDGCIAAALRSTRKAHRDLKPGASYEPPPLPPQSKAAERDRFADALEQWDTETYSDAIDRHYRHAEAADLLKNRRAALASRIKAERKRTLRLLANLEADLGKAGDAEHLRLCGELLKLHLTDIRPRQETLTVPNVFEPDALDVEIQLRPNLSPQQNMERYFRRYKKLAAARGQLAGRLAAARARAEELDFAALAVEEAETIEALDAVAADLGYAGTERGPRRKAPRAGPYRFLSADGLEILVGRTPAQNDEVTFKLSRGNDLWLHVEGYTGSHVVVRLPKGKSAPKETLLDAATLAVHFSQLRKAGGGPVAYCAVKHVTRPRGAGPGQVLYTQNKLLHLDVEPDRLARLMGGEAE